MSLRIWFGNASLSWPLCVKQKHLSNMLSQIQYIDLHEFIKLREWDVYI